MNSVHRFIIGLFLLVTPLGFAQGNGQVQQFGPGGSSSTSSSSTTPISGALADYNFLEGTGTTIKDLSGHGNNGTLGTSTGAPTWVGNGLAFDIAQYVTLPAAINPANTFCVSAYIVPGTSMGADLTLLQYSFLITSSLGASGPNPSLTKETPGSGGFQFVGIYAPGVWSNGSTGTGTSGLISGFHTLCYVLGTGGGNVDRIFIDGAEASYTGQAASAGLQTSGNLYLGATSVTNLGPSAGLLGTMYRFAAFAGQLTPVQIQQVSTQMTTEVASRGVAVTPVVAPSAGAQLYVVGDSITFGTNGVPYITLMTFANQPAWTLNNFGVGGVTVQGIVESEPYRLAPLCRSVQGPAWVIAMAGINDFSRTPDDAASVASFMNAEVGILKNAGCHVLVGTILSNSIFDSSKNAYDIILLNQAKAFGADGVVDFAANPLMGADGASTNTTYFGSDGLHPTTAGYTLMAAAASNSMNYYFGSTLANPHVVTTTTYTLVSGDRAVVAAPTGNAAYTMPDCTGPSGETYTIMNPQSAHTLSIVGGSSQPINGLGTAITISSNSTVVLRDVPNPKATSGCGWSM